MLRLGQARTQNGGNHTVYATLCTKYTHVHQPLPTSSEGDDLLDLQDLRGNILSLPTRTQETLVVKFKQSSNKSMFSGAPSVKDGNLVPTFP